jgi:hypothetical protein
MIAELLKSKYKVWRHNRYLKKHDLTEHQYQKISDPDYEIRATRIVDIYKGYAYIYVFDDPTQDIWIRWGDWLEGLSRLTEWCDANCTDKWRNDVHRVIKCPATSNQWAVNELGGLDFIFFAFKNESDYINFVLRWS